MRTTTIEARDTAEQRPAQTPLVECIEVSRTFGPHAEVTAVRGVTCRIDRDARVALTGPSGSGKSTLLHLMAGLEAPTSGVVRWPGFADPPRSRPCMIGLVFQGPSLVPALNVIENVALPLLLAGTDEHAAVEHAAAALDRLTIGGLGSKLPEQLSGGQAQRVAVARVLASRPRLILADEPTGQLDHATAETVVSVLLAAARELRSALVISTHDPLVAAHLPVRWAMSDGEISQDRS
ncbi:MAG: ABC transporter ATP-binding protein [Actinomycetota bacterium]|nr:ABC transporter ATP-binding protein [Actinomycetota bacterium]